MICKDVQDSHVTTLYVECLFQKVMLAPDI